MKPHKHAALIKAWADGAEIQVKDLTNYDDPCDCKWKDFSEFDDEVWYSKWEYRTKPKTIKYRTYLWTEKAGHSGVWTVTWQQNVDNDYEYNRNFVKWLGDWQEVVVE